MVKTEQQIRDEIARLEGGVKFADMAIKDFESDDPQTCHSFIILRQKYKGKIKTLKWVLNEKV